MARLLGLFALAMLVGSCSAPGFGFQSLEAQTIAACRDGKLSLGEADIDCGEVCGVPCTSGRTCVNDVDCASAFCSAGTCQDQTCSDALKNQDETDFDCGGETGCDRCTAGQACLLASDCDGGACVDGKCRAAACNDQLQNQTESDVDCGGQCGPCPTGKACRTADDCNLAQCTGGKCRAQTCADGLANQDETDLDCGGDSGCKRCATAQHCMADADCDAAACSKGSCQSQSCTDGIANESETDVDCGGSCDPCADLAGCLVANDCTSQVCAGATGKRHCAAPTCSDGTLNGMEPTIDCGAPCSMKCQLADTCFDHNDCASDACTNTHCVPKSPTGTPIVSSGWLASASHTYSTDTAPRFALDGDPSSHWTNGTPQIPGMWFEVDMIKPQVFYNLELTSLSQPSDYPKTLRLTASVDGKTFSELRTGIAGEKDLNIPFAAPQYARYLHFELLASTGGLWWRIDDLRVTQ